MIKLIELALRLWIRSKCSKLDNLDLHINGSLDSLLKGNIEGLTVVAKNFVFQNIPISNANLRSDQINFDVNIGIANRKIILKENFQVFGSILLESDNLSYILFTSKWRWLGNLIEGNFFKNGALKEASIEGKDIKLAYTLGNNNERLYRLCTVYTSLGNLTIEDKEGQSKMELPIDPSIEFINAEIIDSRLIIEGHANVRP